MPVHFKGRSEYKKHYQWFDSYRSKEFVPAPEQAADAAGRTSICTSKCYEPPMQHKKRLDGPPTSLSTNYFSGPSGDSEFALLGQQDKFSTNVPYQLKKQASSSKIYKNKENFDDPTPPSKQLKMQKRIKPLLKERHPPVARSPRVQPASDKTLDSPPLAPREEKPPTEPIVKLGLKDKDLKDVLEESKAGTDAKKSAPGKEEVTHVSAKKDAKKPVAVSASEAPPQYSLKYKAGVAPPRPLRKMSEYQKQFQWKNGMKASPLLAAEQLVYRSNTDLGPYKTEPIHKTSEYRRQFQAWQPIEANVDLSLKLEGINNTTGDKAEPSKKKAKRSKSAGAVLRKQQNDVEEKEEEQDVDEAAELKEKLKKTHGKIRRLGTEYRANFKSPSKFNYSHGAWKGADPPQLAPAAQESKAPAVESKEAGDVSPPPLSNWFAEVIELRRRAQEYRKRAQGTHFSREHLVQLMAKQTDCWDLDSPVSATVNALDLEVARKKGRKAAKEDSPRLSEGNEEFLEDQMEEKEFSVERTEKKRRRQVPRSRKMAYLEEQKEKLAVQQQKIEEQVRMEEDCDNDDEQGDLENEGRQPTPVLQKVKTSARRHHLDLTTPAVGGALLTCPPSKNSKMIVTSRSGDSYVTASDDYQVKQSPKQQHNLDKLLTTPILGMPSGDTHCLRDDDADEDRVLETHYMQTPLPGDDEDDKENSPTKAVKKSGKVGKGRQAAKPAQLSAVQENHGKTYATPKYQAVTLDDIKGQIREPDDDVMSVSMMSVASSSSLASEVLERARRRRQEFWGKKD